MAGVPIPDLTLNLSNSADWGDVSGGGVTFGNYGPLNINNGSGSISTDAAATPQTRQIESAAQLGVAFLFAVVVWVVWPKKRGTR